MHLGRSCGTREVLDKGGFLVGAHGNLNRIPTRQNDSGGHSTMAKGTMAPGGNVVLMTVRHNKARLGCPSVGTPRDTDPRGTLGADGTYPRAAGSDKTLRGSGWHSGTHFTFARNRESGEGRKGIPYGSEEPEEKWSRTTESDEALEGSGLALGNPSHMCSPHTEPHEGLKGCRILLRSSRQIWPHNSIWRCPREIPDGTWKPLAHVLPLQNLVRGPQGFRMASRKPTQSEAHN